MEIPGTTPLSALKVYDMLKPSRQKNALAPHTVTKARKRTFTPLGESSSWGAATQGSSKRVVISFASLPDKYKKMLASPRQGDVLAPNVLKKTSETSLGKEVYYAVQFKLTLDEGHGKWEKRVYRGMTAERQRFAENLAQQGYCHRKIFSELRKASQTLPRDDTAQATISAPTGSGEKRKITFKLSGTFTDPDVAGVAREIALNRIKQLGDSPQREQVHAAISTVHTEIIEAARHYAARMNL